MEIKSQIFSSDTSNLHLLYVSTFLFLYLMGNDMVDLIFGVGRKTIHVKV